MKLLLFSDLHCDARAARNLVDRSREVDVVVGAGDFATGRRHLEVTIDVLRDIDRPTVLVPGNSESQDELELACEGWKPARVLHGSGTTIDGQTFFGLGGAVPVTPFGSWSWDLTEDDAAKLLESCPPRAILVSHSPPQGLVDQEAGGRNLGSTAVRDALERTAPMLVVCGHIHASGGRRTRHRQTAVVNAGPDGMVWEV